MATVTLQTTAPSESRTARRDRRPAGRRAITIRRLRSNRMALVGLGVVVLLFAAAFLGPYLTHWKYTDIDYMNIATPPSADHWFGTDSIGHDLFAQTMRGLQKSLLIGLLVGIVQTAIAGFVGAVAGYFGGWADRLVTFGIDVLLVLPQFLIIAIISPRIRNSGWLVLVGLLIVFGWMITARIIRSMTLSLRDQDYVRAARFMGVHPVRIIQRHILPNVASFLIIDATVQIGLAVMAETGLSYFGFGVQPPDVSLGTLIQQGQDAATTSPWMFYFAVLLLVVFILAVNLFGDGLRDALDPTSGRDRPMSRRRRRALVEAGAPTTQEGDGALAPVHSVTGGTR